MRASNETTNLIISTGGIVQAALREIIAIKVRERERVVRVMKFLKQAEIER